MKLRLKATRSGLAQDCLIGENSGLGFPEFESGHLVSFSTKAQFSKSAASTIPPCPHDEQPRF